MSRKPPLQVALISLGCPKNLVDSEKILAHLAQAGCVVGAPQDQADVIIVNTCGFLSAAREESLGVIREALAAKQARGARVVVAGCLVNRDADKLYEIAPGIDAIVGVNDRDSILAAVTASRRVSRLSEVPTAGTGATRKPVMASDAGRFRLTARHTAYLRISEGCSQRCTFCTIPSIRGPFRSKAPADVLAEARELAADGAIELNIIGQDTTTYGIDLPDGRPSLNTLLAQISEIPGPQWLRLMYAYPRRFTDELIDALARLPQVVKYVDLPLQHIADGVLKRMGRGVGRSPTEKLLHRLRDRVPGLVLRTTFIVGFPGETDEHFEELLAFVRDFKFDALGVFEYSPEEGTPASRLKGHVEPAVKARRAREIMLAQRKIAFAANRRKVGRTLRVLVDGSDAAGRCVGRYYGQAPEIDSVCILDKPVPAGTMVDALVVGSAGYDLRVKVC
jgi:ribosomal protein S12 methylthiotransferase